MWLLAVLSRGAWVPEQCACVVSNLNMSKPDLSLPESGELCTDIK